MLRRVWKPVAATVVVVGAPAYYYYRSYSTQTFDLSIRTRDSSGKSQMSSKTFTLLPLKESEARIRADAISEAYLRPDGLAWKYTTAQLSSNDPIEDAFANQIVARDESDPSAPGDYLFFAVMDGHGGYQTSHLLSRILIKAVAAELTNLLKDPNSASQPGLLDRVRSLLWQSPSTSPSFDASPARVSQAIQLAFTELDDELLSRPLRILANTLGPEGLKKRELPDLSQHPEALSSMLPAISGSCALMAIFDTAHRDIYVACTGDSRAVAGVWEPSQDGKGQWRIEALSEDQTGRNPSELARVRSEHPKDEEDYVIREGRILGGLEPSRAFGDARYKWPLPVQEALNQVFMVGNGMPMRNPPSQFKTPPYVTAKPVVVHRKMSLPSPSGSEPPKDATRFLVLATDGLWDQLSNEEVVSLVAGHLSGLKGIVPKSELPNLVPTTSGSAGINGKKQKNLSKEEGSWAFVDDNISAHLIRNAFGGGDESLLRRFLSIPAPHSRRYRDDVTVTVVCWEEGNEANVRIVREKIKSKL
ncbi:phosphatase 2C-like domain-containing protein [Gymnopilus junonius]|uniref:Phosphatase 2C-like domain-containing protein n=1 Tax=Gymnopilus junonius TaxID=109634 RepID=A0A9P5NZ54_GYMJU|nr:phosphatase 2C-like domain-containing protein [Gymnopilus junonius]